MAPSCPLLILQLTLPTSQDNLISKVPRGALSRQTHLRELYLQHNQLTDSGLDATTFRWGTGQGRMGDRLLLAIDSEDSESGAPPLCPPPLYDFKSKSSFGSTYCVCSLGEHLQLPMFLTSLHWFYHPASQLPDEDLGCRALSWSTFRPESALVTLSLLPTQISQLISPKMESPACISAPLLNPQPQDLSGPDSGCPA